MNEKKSNESPQSSSSVNKKLNEFEDFISGLEAEIEAKNQEDFSPHALFLADHPYHYQIPENADKMVQKEWRGPCGDSVRWYLDIHDGILKNAFYTTDGCTTASIASSQTAMLVENLPLEKVRQITDKKVLEALGKFPQEDWHCATLAVTALQLTLDKYQRRN
ncbi:MAG: hypothetical protein DRO88_13885 [Promethearchaeia archaeon]|nr:MAG: hypothetical protein DRO88_13885 [Candidatus Lokiarchaeia archaeon]